MKEPDRDDQSNIKILKGEKGHISFFFFFPMVPDSLRQREHKERKHRPSTHLIGYILLGSPLKDMLFSISKYQI